MGRESSEEAGTGWCVPCVKQRPKAQASGVQQQMTGDNWNLPQFLNITDCVDISQGPLNSI